MDFNRSTAELHHSIRNATDIEDYLQKEQEQLLTIPLHKYLNDLLHQKGLSRADVVRGSLLDRAYLYQIFNGQKIPSRDKLIAIAFGLHLNEQETQRMLRLGGRSELYPRVERDAVILFAILHEKSIDETNELLNQHGFPTLLSLDR